MVVYKATNTPGFVVPGFTSSNRKVAESYLINNDDGSEIGGSTLVQMTVKPSTKKLTELVMCNGPEDAQMLFMPGIPVVLQHEGDSEVVVLEKVQQVVVSSHFKKTESASNKGSRSKCGPVEHYWKIVGTQGNFKLLCKKCGETVPYIP
jgi:hypothetical protein